jgi:hypothetical protein
MIYKINVLAVSRSGHTWITENLRSWKKTPVVTPIENFRGRLQLIPADLNFIVLRDYLNNLASLVAFKWGFITSSIASWEFLAKEATLLSDSIPYKDVIFYDRFRESAEYRQHICSKIEGNYTEEKLFYVPPPKSSFQKTLQSGKKLKVDQRWLEIQQKPADKNAYLNILRQFPETIKLYVKIFKPTEDKMKFLIDNKLYQK